VFCPSYFGLNSLDIVILDLLYFRRVPKKRLFSYDFHRARRYIMRPFLRNVFLIILNLSLLKIQRIDIKQLKLFKMD
jgi:hypothetical protein